MSTIRSLITGMLPIGSTVMTGVVWPSSGGFQPMPCAVLAASSRCVWQASAGLPLMRTPHEPQIAARQEQRMPIEPSRRSRACRTPSRTERWPSSSIGKSCQVAASPDSGVKRRILRVYSGMGLVGALLRLVPRDGHRRVGHLGTVLAERQVDVLEPLVVLALREVETELGAARLLALERSDDDALRRVEHVAELDGAEDVLVEHRAAIVDRRRGGLH